MFLFCFPQGSIFPSHKPSDTVFKVFFWLGYVNSCINPMIYPCFSQEFKKAFQNVLCCRCFRRRRKPSIGPSKGNANANSGYMVAFACCRGGRS